MMYTLVSAFFVGAAADCYLQYPPGSNNRLDEGGGNRNNNNRLMDTQNNAKGGYGYGGSADNKAMPLKYFTGSKLSTMWTSQHSCGSENNECQIVIQYMCNPTQMAPAGLRPNTATGDGEGPIRDGTDDTTPDPADPDPATGLHEPATYYNDCEARERNKGLYTADQNVNNNKGATATRQNPNGQRSGQECPEERDYYPYWHPSPWKDVAILTNNLHLCDFYKANSQNVAGKNYCSINAENNEADCIAATDADGTAGEWLLQPAHNIPPPECVSAPFQRDNHLGNGPTGQEVMYNWTIPSDAGLLGADDADNCVARFRYNITTADTKVCGGDPVWVTMNNMTALNTQALCVAAGGIWSALYLDSTYNELVDGNDNRANGNQLPGLLEQDPEVDMGGFLTEPAGLGGASVTDSLLELAINTNQYGRTFQDRTHVFSIQSRPIGIASTTQIYNLNVKGKRGNIVQTYPATEYDFTPNEFEVGLDDLVHVQWTGNDNTNNNGNNNGEGTNNEDRHNIVQISSAANSVPMAAAQGNMFDVAWEWNPEPTGSTFGGARNEAEMQKQFALVKQTGCLTEQGLKDARANGGPGGNGANDGPKEDQNRQNCQKLNAAAATVDLGLIKFKAAPNGQKGYRYMSSRNNNFSNRAQKAHLNVLDKAHVPPDNAVITSVVPVETGDKARSTVLVTWAPPGSETPTTDYDTGATMPGKEQAANLVSDYIVQYSIDGGEAWVDVEYCRGKITSCEVTDLPAGTNTAFKVLSGGNSEWSDGSEIGVVRTVDSSASSDCQNMLVDQANGDYVAPGTIVAAVFGALAILMIIAAALFYFKRRQPPPPPGVYDAKTTPSAY